MSQRAEIVRSAVPITTNILIVGGAYAGLSALVALKNHLRNRNLTPKVSATIVEPKAGLFNILGIPKCIVDTEFAKTQYVPLQDLEDIKFQKLISDDAEVCGTLGNCLLGEESSHSFTYVQGLVEELTSKRAVYSLNNSPESKAVIDFDYAILATGRNRKWPTSPLAYNFKSYLSEMEEFNRNVSKCKRIGIIGAGAVGIEIAGDIKNKFKDTEVYLIHPHAKFPPEPLSEDFQDACRKSLEDSGVHILTNHRVELETDDKKLIFTNGDELQTDFNYWCNSFKNNTELLKDDLSKFVSERNNIHVNEYLQFYKPDGEQCVYNVFAIGDLVELPIIKSAGWALYMGRQVANNIVSLIADGKLVEKFPDLTQMPKGMVLIAGNEELISLLNGIVEINNENYVEEYKDYCLGKIRATLGA